MKIPQEIQDLMPERRELPTSAEFTSMNTKDKFKVTEDVAYNQALTEVEAVLPQMLTLAEKRGAQAERERIIEGLETVKIIGNKRYEDDVSPDQARIVQHFYDNLIKPEIVKTLTQPNHE